MVASRRFGARVAVFALILGLTAICMPSTQWLGVNSPFNAVSNVSASPDDYEINIGFCQMAISTLNPFCVATLSEWLVIWPCYSTLLMNDFDGTGFIGDLATSWNVSSDGTLWHFHICDNAYFYDDREAVQTHMVTAADVIFSYWIVQNYTSNRIHSLVTDLGDVPLPLIVGMWSDGPFEVYIQTSAPYAPFYRTLATVPIVPKYYWEGSNPMNFLNDPPIGSGPFYYDGEGLPITNVCSLKRNPVWYQTEERGWQIHAGTVNLKSFIDEEQGYAALTADPPQIDVLLDVSRDIYLNQIPAEDPSKKLIQFEANNGFAYYVILNQMTDEMREYLGGICEYGSNNELLLDSVIKRAVAMCVDKSGFVDEVLDGLGSVANSFVPSTSEWHYSYGTDPEDSPIPFDPAQARSELMDAGWSYDSEGEPAISTTVPLCRAGGADPLEFRFATYNFATEYIEGALMLKDNCSDAGIKLNLELHSANEMMTLWVAGDYDLALWDWTFYPLGDPSADTLSLMTTMAIGVCSDTYYSNATFDSLYNDSIAEMPFETRAPIMDEMQRMAYEDASSQSVAYRHSLYAATERYWTGYGNWSENYMLLPDLCLPWLYMRISPVANMAPVVEVDTDFYGITGTPVSVSASVGDDSSPLEYKWFWDDGSSTDWIPGTSGIADHTYVESGSYFAYVAAREAGGDGFITWNRTSILVQDVLNYPPYPDPVYEDTPITYEPAYPDTADSIIFTSHFVDDECDDLAYFWDFGDGETATSSEVEHTYSAPGTYTVSLSVTDDQEGPGERPTVASVTVYVAENTAPTFVLTLPSTMSLLPGEVVDLSIIVADADNDPVTVTWDFGDGTIAVNSTGNALTGVPVSQTHAWSPDIEPGMGPVLYYSLVVTLEDPYSNTRTTTTSVGIQLPYNGLPIIYLRTSASLVNLEEEMTFYANATDPEGEALTWTWVINNSIEDIEVLVSHTDATPPGTKVWNNVTYAFSNPGTYIVRLHVSDALIPYQIFPHNVTKSVQVAVVGNSAPSVTSVISVSPESPQIDVAIGSLDVYLEIQAFDYDGDVLTASWYIGSAVDPVVNVSAGGIVVYEFTQVMTITETGSYNVSVVVTDGYEGHEVTVCRTIDATSNNLPPSICLFEFFYASGNYAIPMEEIEFQVVITDAELDPVEVIFEFGDDSPQRHFSLTDYVNGNVTIVISHAYQLPGVYLGTIWYTDNEIGILNHSKVYNMEVTVKEASVIEDISPPVADAGEDQEVNVGEEVQFDGIGSDDDIGIVNFTWKFTYDDEARELYEVDPTFTFEIADEYTVMLTVKDAANKTATDDIVITVLAVNEAPVANAGPDQAVIVGTEVTFVGSGSSDDVEIENYTWIFTYDDEARELHGVSPKFTFDIPGTYVVTLIIEDAEGETSTDTVTITVEEKSFIESYGLALGIVIALVITALVLLFILKGRKGGMAPTIVEEISTGEPEVPGEGLRS